VNWTTEFPTKPGFYWIRNFMANLGPGFIDSTPRPGPFVVEVSEQGATVGFTGSDDTWERKEIISAEWYGPIDPPAEPSDRSEAITALRQIYERLDILYAWPGDEASLVEIINKLDGHIEAQEMDRYNDAVEAQEKREMKEWE
jgi:hypothetical protein